MDWVLDCSLALAWGLPDETSKRADRFLVQVSRKSTFWVPALWWYEISNALTVAQRRQRLTEADSMRLVELYRLLPIETDAYLSPDILWRFHTLAEEHALPAYDAAYLELAQRKGLGLATLDRRLMRAARRAGVKLISA
ncbi:MAG: type II toxin-antitoxin system VapC family toxin [Acidobacteria bacterium]|nr:type II toxin-antitoxin system VapC family toxin [Acidobacteriota bacterium]